MNRQQRRKLQKKLKALKAFERFADGKAQGGDFIEVARFMRAAKVLPAKTAYCSNQEIAKILQQTDRLISEGVIRLKGFEL